MIKLIRTLAIIRNFRTTNLLLAALKDKIADYFSDLMKRVEPDHFKIL